VKLTREQLLPTTRKLLSQLETEFEFYLPEADSDQLVAIILHPVMASNRIR
jgi:hypothetical protein